MKMLKRLIVFIPLIFLLAACNLPSNAPASTPESNVDPVQLTIEAINVQKTIEAQNQQPDQPTDQLPTADQPQSLPSATSDVIAPTNTPQPSFTPFPTATKTKLPTQTPTEVPCLKATFITDVTIPDGKDFEPGDSFTKTWRLMNSGSCTWTSGYKIIFDHGDQMGGNAQKQLTASSVAPGQTVDVSINMIAPASEGTYQGYWKLKDPQGEEFGIGSDGDSEIWVKIDVIEPEVSYSYTASFDNVHMCGSLQYATIRVDNTGTEFFESMSISIKDITDNVMLYNTGTSNSPFLPNANDCPPANSDLDPGETYYIAVSIGSSPTSGNTARVTLKICSEDTLGGTCISKTINFEIP